MTKAYEVLFCDGGWYFERLLIPILKECLRNLAINLPLRSRNYERLLFRRNQANIVIASVFGNTWKRTRGDVNILISGETVDLSLLNGAHEWADLIIDSTLSSVASIAEKTVFFPLIGSTYRGRILENRSPLEKSSSQIQEWLGGKSKFCAYLYSYDVPHRVGFFDLLHQLKDVDALGKSRQNVPRKLDRAEANWFERSIEMYRPYRFVICIENRRVKGYVTEKLLAAMLAGAVPIYLGAPDFLSFLPFNSNAIIDVSSFPSHEACVKEIVRIENNPEIWAEMVRTSWFKDDMIPEIFEAKELISSLTKVIGQINPRF